MQDSTKCDTETRASKRHWKNGSNRLARCRAATNLQLVKNAASVKYRKTKYNKTRYTCMYVHVRGCIDVSWSGTVTNGTLLESSVWKGKAGWFTGKSGSRPLVSQPFSGTTQASCSLCSQPQQSYFTCWRKYQ